MKANWLLTAARKRLLHCSFVSCICTLYSCSCVPCILCVRYELQGSASPIHARCRSLSCDIDIDYYTAVHHLRLRGTLRNCWCPPPCLTVYIHLTKGNGIIRILCCDVFFAKIYCPQFPGFGISRIIVQVQKRWSSRLAQSELAPTPCGLRHSASQTLLHVLNSHDMSRCPMACCNWLLMV